MKLYMHPVSMTSRPVRLFLAENNIACEEEVVDLMKGAHQQEPYAQPEPARQEFYGVREMIKVQSFVRV